MGSLKPIFLIEDICNKVSNYYYAIYIMAYEKGKIVSSSISKPPSKVKRESTPPVVKRRTIKGVVRIW